MKQLAIPQLNPSGIRFDEEAHKYYKDVVDETTGEIVSTEELNGITSTVIRWMFPDTYASVPQATLDAAAEHGSYVHKCIEMSDVVGATDDCPESQEFLDMMAENHMTVVAHEYIVTAYDRFASPIDLVLMDEEGGIWLADIKTTSALHTPKVRLQLSIYALFFELQNPHLQVKGIVEVWLPKSQYRKKNYQGYQVIPRTSAKDTEETIGAFLNMFDPQLFLPRFMDEESALPLRYQDIIYDIALNERIAKEAKAKSDELKAVLLSAMEEYNVTSKVDSPWASVSYVASSSRSTIDSKKLQSSYPDIYAACLNTSNTKPSLRITIK